MNINSIDSAPKCNCNPNLDDMSTQYVFSAVCLVLILVLVF